MSSIPTWTAEAYPGTIAVVNPHPDSDSGYMVIRKEDLRPEHELFGPEGKGYPPDHIPPSNAKAMPSDGNAMSSKEWDGKAISSEEWEALNLIEPLSIDRFGNRIRREDSPRRGRPPNPKTI